MPFVNAKLIEGVFSSEQKPRIVWDLTDVMAAIEGEHMRQVSHRVSVVAPNRRASPTPTGSPTRRGPGCPYKNS